MIEQKIFKYFKGTKDEFVAWLASHPERKTEVDKSVTFIHPVGGDEGTIYTRGDYYDIHHTNISIEGGAGITIDENNVISIKLADTQGNVELDLTDGLKASVDLSTYYTKTEVDAAVTGKVDKEEGKGLSSNDYTDAEKAKLEGIEEGAQANKVEVVKINGEAAPIVEKAVNIKVPKIVHFSESSTGQKIEDILTATAPVSGTSAIDETIAIIKNDDIAIWEAGARRYTITKYYINEGYTAISLVSTDILNGKEIELHYATVWATGGKTYIKHEYLSKSDIAASIKLGAELEKIAKVAIDGNNTVIELLNEAATSESVIAEGKEKQTLTTVDYVENRLAWDTLNTTNE